MSKPMLHSGPLHWEPHKVLIVYLQEFESLHVLGLLYKKGVHTSQILLTAADYGCNGLHKEKINGMLSRCTATLCREIDVTCIISILNLFQTVD